MIYLFPTSITALFLKSSPSPRPDERPAKVRRIAVAVEQGVHRGELLINGSLVIFIHALALALIHERLVVRQQRGADAGAPGH